MFSKLNDGFEGIEDRESTDVHQDSYVSSSTQKQANVTDDSMNGPTVGSDSWKHLKGFSISVFNGDKRTFESWKAAFSACVDKAPLTPGYKLEQLRQYLSDKVLKALENIGFSTIAYEAAKDRQERKFGGQRRQVM